MFVGNSMEVKSTYCSAFFKTAKIGVYTLLEFSHTGPKLFIFEGFFNNCLAFYGKMGQTSV